MKTNTKNCIIERYDKTITEAPFTSIRMDEVEVEEPEINNDLGSTFAEILRVACREKGYMFKFYTMSQEEGYDYNITVWNEDMSM